MNMICWNWEPLVEPRDRSKEGLAALTSKNTVRILNTIKPVTRPFTAMVRAKLVVSNGRKVIGFKVGAICTTQIARGHKLKLTYQMKIDRPT